MTSRGSPKVDDAFDLAIVGAGPAGTAAALRALELDADARVVLVDHAAFPRDKPCGDGLGPETVALLEDLGVGDVLEGATPFTALEIRGPGRAALLGQVDDPGCVLPRRVFDSRLVDAAVARGAELHRERVKDVATAGDHVVMNGRIKARVVVAADGANSVVRRRIGLGGQPGRHNAAAVRGYGPSPPDGPRRLQFRFPVDPWPAYAWCFPGPGGRANVGLVTIDGRAKVSRRRMLQTMSEVLGDAQPDPGTIRGHRLPLATDRPAASRGKVLLAGDAAALVNPLSGEGIATALLSGALAGESAVTAADPGPAYRAALNQRLRRHLRHVRLAARLYRSPSAVDQVLTTASSSDRTFRELVSLSIGAGHLSPATLARLLVNLPRATLLAQRSRLPSHPESGLG